MKASVSVKYMIKAVTLILLITMPGKILQAQNYSIFGIVLDESGRGIAGANAVVLNQRDSSVIKGSTTDDEGKFRITGLYQTRHLLRITFIGYEDFLKNVDLSGRGVDMGKIILKEKATLMTEVEISIEIIPVQQRGDTTEYNAEAFKTNPDASVEELVAKMPGIAIKDGKVQAQGEEVKKVRVDGRDFFGDDVNTAIKNLPAEVVDRIQVFDEKSEQSRLTGFDDGNTTKTMNIVTRPVFRNGVFGKANVGYGWDDKWKAGLSLNVFQDSRRITILFNSNNLNEQNFFTEDMHGLMGTNISSGGRGGVMRFSANDIGSFMINQRSGITTTHSFGLNFADEWKSLIFTASYFLNYSENMAKSDLLRQYFSGQVEDLSYLENSQSTSNNTNHRLNFRLEWKIDTLKSIIIQPRLSLQENNGESLLFGENTSLSSLINNTNNDYSSDLSGINFSAPIFYRHALRKKGRSMSINITPSLNQNKGNSLLKSYSLFYDDIIYGDTLDQEANLFINGTSVSSNIAYTEPLSESSQIMLNYRNNFSMSNSDKETFNHSVIDDSYDLFDTSLSNNYGSLFQSHALGLTYRYRNEKWNMNTGVTYQYASLKGEQIFPYPFNLSKDFNSILPNISFQYRFSKSKNLLFNYRSSNNTPSVNQLQEVINNNNPLQLKTGNPELEQDWRNMFTMRYSSSNTEKMTSFFTLLGGTFTQNHIVSSTFIAFKDTLIAPDILLPRGSQLSKPVNLDGYFNIRSFNNYSFPVKKIKSNISLNIGSTFSRTPGMINDNLNFANAFNIGFGLTLSSNISERFDFMISSNSNYNNISNSIRTHSNNTYYNQNTRLSLNIMPTKKLLVQTFLSHQYNSGLTTDYNQNYLLWNAAVAYKFLKNNAAEIRISVFDIMKQNNSIQRNLTETYYEDVQHNVLEQYFLLGFTYNIRKFKNSDNQEKDNNSEQKERSRQ